MDINVTLPVLNFGPLSVLPEYQRQGVGKALVQAMIKKAKRLDYGAILFLGRPEYYPRKQRQTALYIKLNNVHAKGYFIFYSGGCPFLYPFSEERRFTWN